MVLVAYQVQVLGLIFVGENATSGPNVFLLNLAVWIIVCHTNKVCFFSVSFVNSIRTKVYVC